jgi:hypothetical protein
LDSLFKKTQKNSKGKVKLIDKYYDRWLQSDYKIVKPAINVIHGSQKELIIAGFAKDVF